MSKLTVVVNSVSTVVSLAEHDVFTLLLSSDDEVSNFVVTGTEDTALINAEVEFHVGLVASLLVPSTPDFCRVHGELKISVHTL
jgi:hypothetical protein